MYNSMSALTKKWISDNTSNWNVHCTDFKEYTEVIILYYGFDFFGTYTETNS